MKKCPHCRWENPDKNVYCKICGANLLTDEMPKSTPSPAPTMSTYKESPKKLLGMFIQWFGYTEDTIGKYIKTWIKGLMIILFALAVIGTLPSLITIFTVPEMGWVSFLSLLGLLISLLLIPFAFSFAYGFATMIEDVHQIKQNFHAPSQSENK